MDPSAETFPDYGFMKKLNFIAAYSMGGPHQVLVAKHLVGDPPGAVPAWGSGRHRHQNTVQNPQLTRSSFSIGGRGSYGMGGPLSAPVLHTMVSLVCFFTKLLYTQFKRTAPGLFDYAYFTQPAA